jgi:hypothetical protein
VAAVKVNEGTQTTLQTIAVGGTETPVVRLDVGNGASGALFTGTLTNLGKGTITKVEGGTLGALAVGTITAGTVDALTIGLRHGDEFATVVTGTGTATGTVKAAVSGSAIYVTGLVISAGTAADTRVGLSSGTGTLNNVLGTLCFGSNGGLCAMPINPPLRTTSGSALVWSQAGTSNVTITAVGYVD